MGDGGGRLESPSLSRLEWEKNLWPLVHRSSSTRCLFFQKGSGGGESAERLPWAEEGKAGDSRVTEPPRGLRGCVLRWRGRGSSAPDQDS